MQTRPSEISKNETMKSLKTGHFDKKVKEITLLDEKSGVSDNQNEKAETIPYEHRKTPIANKFKSEIMDENSIFLQLKSAIKVQKNDNQKKDFSTKNIFDQDDMDIKGFTASNLSNVDPRSTNKMTRQTTTQNENQQNPFDLIYSKIAPVQKNEGESQLSLQNITSNPEIDNNVLEALKRESEKRNTIISGLKEEINLKFVVIGDSGVGKSTLLVRFTKNAFLGDIKSTIGIDLLSYETKIEDVHTFVQFWDTAGQEKFRGMVSTYYKSCHAVILVYDITNKASFLHLDQWIAEIRTYADNDVQLLLIGNKTDLEYERRVSKKEVDSYVAKNRLTYMEVSAKDNQNRLVNQAFEELIFKTFKQHLNPRLKKKQEKFAEIRIRAKNLKVPEFSEDLVQEARKEKIMMNNKKNCCV